METKVNSAGKQQPMKKNGQYTFKNFHSPNIKEEKVEISSNKYKDLNKLEEEEYDKVYNELATYSMYDWKLNKGEKNAIEDYTTESVDYNDYLREGKPYTTYSDDYDEVIDKISRVIDKYELKDNIKVFRVSDNQLIKNAKVGDIVSDKAFISTTPFKASLYDYKKKWGAFKDYNYEILVPKGKGRGAYIAPYSHFGYSEEEFLLQKDSKFKVVSINGKNIKLELLTDDISNKK